MTDDPHAASDPHSVLYENYRDQVAWAGRALYPQRQQVYRELSSLEGDAWVCRNATTIWKILNLLEEQVLGRDSRDDWRKAGNFPGKTQVDP